MVSMFYGASAFNQDISNWNVTNVTVMGWIFMNAAAFNQELSNWDVSSVSTCSDFSADSGITNTHLPTFTNCSP